MKKQPANVNDASTADDTDDDDDGDAGLRKVNEIEGQQYISG